MTVPYSTLSCLRSQDFFEHLSAGEIIDELVLTAACSGNLLLNAGPTERIPPAQRRCVGGNPSDATPGSEEQKPFDRNASEGYPFDRQALEGRSFDSRASEGNPFDAWWSEGHSFDSWVSEVHSFDARWSEGDSYDHRWRRWVPDKRWFDNCDKKEGSQGSKS